MKCKYVQQHMLDYAEQVLDQGKQQQIAQHVQTCRECSQELEALRNTLGLLASDTSFQEPPQAFWDDFTNTVMRKVRAAEPPQAPRLAWSGWPMRLAAACAIVALLITGWLAYREFRTHQSVMTTRVTAPEPRPTLDTELERLVPEAAPRDMLDAPFALSGQTGAPPLEVHSDTVTVEGLISGLSDEEKRTLLLELYKMQKPSE